MRIIKKKTRAMILSILLKRKDYFLIIEVSKFTRDFFFTLFFFKKIILSIAFLSFFFFFRSNKKFLFDRSNRRDDLFRFEDISIREERLSSFRSFLSNHRVTEQTLKRFTR